MRLGFPFYSSIPSIPSIPSIASIPSDHVYGGQMQRTLRAKLLKSAPAADRSDERDKAQLASESSGTSPAWRNSVACIRVLQWLEAGERQERMEQEERERGQESSVGRSALHSGRDGLADDSLGALPSFRVHG